MRDIKDIAKYIGLSLLSKGLSVSPLKLQKLLYYAQSWYMVFFGRDETLFNKTPQAWVNGPVYPSIFQEYRDKTSNMCDHLRAEDFGVSATNINNVLSSLSEKLCFTNEEIELLDSVIMLYGAKTQNALILLTHSEQPWVEARGDLEPYVSSQMEISLDTMYNYYKARHDRNRGKQ